MGDLGDPSKIPALLALLAPGFIILWVRSRVVEGPTVEFSQQLFHFALVSAAYYGLIGPLFHVSRGLALPAWAWSILFYFAVPAALAYGIGLITKRGLEYAITERLGIRFLNRIPTAWDYRFGEVDEATFVLATLKDGTTIGGRMAFGSYAASAKDGRDLYIAEIWRLPDTEGGDWIPVMPRRGALICGDEIRYVEFSGGQDG
jgi:Family of unknown function (DUF6338)